MKREAETSWAAERVENALLRERINDVAAEVARLTAVLEGPGSPIETILAGNPSNGGESEGPGRAHPRPAKPRDADHAAEGELIFQPFSATSALLDLGRPEPLNPGLTRLARLPWLPLRSAGA